MICSAGKNGADTRAYVYSDTTDGFAAGDDLTHIATIVGVQQDGFNVADFIMA